MSPAFTLSSPATATDYWIYLAGAVDTATPKPAVVFLDGDDQFKFAVSAYRALRKSDQVPDLLLVGVGYGASYTKPANRRGRDYTPVAHADEATSGGGDGFLAFLTQTLWPELSRRHALDPHQRGIAGHSLGSLLVLHALFQPMPFFTHHLASAPSLWWADRAILQQTEELRRAQASLPAQLYLSVGEKDTASMTGDLTLLEQQLAASPFAGLAVTCERFPHRDHFNVLPHAFRAGLLALFGRKPPYV